MLNGDMPERCEDLLLMDVLDWVINLFSNTEEDEAVKEELIEPHDNIHLKTKV